MCGGWIIEARAEASVVCIGYLLLKGLFPLNFTRTLDGECNLFFVFTDSCVGAEIFGYFPYPYSSSFYLQILSF